MQTSLFQVVFYDGRKFNVFCSGKNQIQRFRIITSKLSKEIESIAEISKGIHTIAQFEKITTNLLS